MFLYFHQSNGWYSHPTVFENYAIEKVKHDDIRDGMDAGLCGDR
jgi:hypothetical protein